MSVKSLADALKSLEAFRNLMIRLILKSRPSLRRPKNCRVSIFCPTINSAIQSIGIVAKKSTKKSLFKYL